jgi:proline iminopeptidase
MVSVCRTRRAWQHSYMWEVRAHASVLSCLMIALLLGGCASSRVENGYVNVIGGKVYYKMIDRSGGAGRTPLIVVHGGPGVPHQYLASLEALADERPIIFYDQLGCGKSDRPEGDQLWIPRRFAREIGAIREELGINECFILADSWGAIPTTEYLLTMPRGVKGVVLSSPILSGPRYVADANHLLDQLPRDVANTIRKHEHAGTTDSREYRDAYREFYKRHVYRRGGQPKELSDALASMGADSYRVMHGPNEINLSGTLRDYDRTSDLWQIKQPVLITAGKYDEVTPETAAYYSGKLNNAKLVIFKRSAHMPIFEEREKFIETVREFLEWGDS